jgi:hypothetical protein
VCRLSAPWARQVICDQFDDCPAGMSIAEVDVGELVSVDHERRLGFRGLRTRYFGPSVHYGGREIVHEVVEISESTVSLLRGIEHLHRGVIGDPGL